MNYSPELYPSQFSPLLRTLLEMNNPTLGGESAFGTQGAGGDTVSLPEGFEGRLASSAASSAGQQMFGPIADALARSGAARDQARTIGSAGALTGLGSLLQGGQNVASAVQSGIGGAVGRGGAIDAASQGIRGAAQDFKQAYSPQSGGDPYVGTGIGVIDEYGPSIMSALTQGATAGATAMAPYVAGAESAIGSAANQYLPQIGQGITSAAVGAEGFAGDLVDSASDFLGGAMGAGEHILGSYADKAKGAMGAGEHILGSYADKAKGAMSAGEHILGSYLPSITSAVEGAPTAVVNALSGAKDAATGFLDSLGADAQAPARGNYVPAVGSATNVGAGGAPPQGFPDIIPGRQIPAADSSYVGPPRVGDAPRVDAEFEEIFGSGAQQEADAAFVRVNDRDGGGDPNVLLQAVEGAAGQPGAAGASEGVMDQMSEFMETLGEGAGMLGQVIGAPIGLAGELIKPIFGAVDNALIEPFQDLLNHPRSQARQRREDLAGLLPSAIKAKQAGLRGALEGAVARYPGLRDVLTPELMAQFLPPMEAPTTEQSWFERVTETSGEEASRRMAEMRALAEPARAGLAQGDAFLEEVLKKEPGLTTMDELKVALAKAETDRLRKLREQKLTMAGQLAEAGHTKAAQEIYDSVGIRTKITGIWPARELEIVGREDFEPPSPLELEYSRQIAERGGGQTESLALPSPEEAAPAQGEGGSALAQLRAMESRGELAKANVPQGIRDSIVAGTMTEAQAVSLLELSSIKISE